MDPSEVIRSETLGGDEGHPDRKLILGVMCLVLVLVIVSVSSMNVALPSIIRDLQPTSAQSLWIVDSYALVFAGLLLPAGAIGDKYGRKKALIVGLAVFGVGALAAFFASSAMTLILIRGAMGIGAAFAMPATLSIITHVFPPNERAKAIAVWAGFAGAGGAIGVVSSGVILRWFEWSAVFLINVPLVILALGLVARFVPWSKSESSDPLDPIGAALSIGGFFALLYAIIEGPEKGWTSGIVFASFVMALVLLGAFVVYELKTQYPMLDPRVFLIRRFGVASLIVTVLFAVMFGQFFLVAQYFQLVMGQSALESGIRTLPFALTMVAISPRAPDLASRIGARNLLLGGLILQSGGFAVLSRVGVGSPYLEVCLGIVLMGSGMALIMPTLTEVIVSSLPQDKAGVASAVNDTTREVGGAVGIAVMGSLLATGYKNSVEPVSSELPEDVGEAAADSIGAALAIAEKMGPSGEALVEAAQQGFVDGMSTAMSVAAVMGIVMTLVVALTYPNET